MHSLNSSEFNSFFELISSPWHAQPVQLYAHVAQLGKLSVTTSKIVYIRVRCFYYPLSSASDIKLLTTNHALVALAEITFLLFLLFHSQHSFS